MSAPDNQARSGGLPSRPDPVPKSPGLTRMSLRCGECCRGSFLSGGGANRSETPAACQPACQPAIRGVFSPAHNFDIAPHARYPPKSFKIQAVRSASASLGRRLYLPDSTSGPQMGLHLERSSTTGGLPPKARPFPGDRSIPDRFRGAHMSKPCATPITVKHPHSRDGSAKPQPTSSSGRINARRPSSVTLRSTNN